MIEKLLERILLEKKNIDDYTRDTIQQFDRENLLINTEDIISLLDEELLEGEEPKDNKKKYVDILLMILISVFIYNIYQGYKEEERGFREFAKNQEKIISDLKAGNIPKIVESRFKESNIEEYERIGHLIDYIKDEDDISLDKKQIYEELRILVQGDQELSLIINESDFSRQEMLTYMAIFIYNIINKEKK